jgi:hypothetical protein
MTRCEIFQLVSFMDPESTFHSRAQTDAPISARSALLHSSSLSRPYALGIMYKHLPLKIVAIGFPRLTKCWSQMGRSDSNPGYLLPRGETLRTGSPIVAIDLKLLKRPLALSCAVF